MMNKKYEKSIKREEKIARLGDALSVLKKEFVGLSEIIDELGNAITPWYITPEVIHRPVVISLWGMTGTGKTSVVRRLIDLLGLAGSTMMFDCGTESNDGCSMSVSDKIGDFLHTDSESTEVDNFSKDLVFVFDEFQYARTIDEHGEEIQKSNLRAVWSLIDSGIVNLSNDSWEVGYYNTFLEDFGGFVRTGENSKIPVKNCVISDKDSIRSLLQAIGLFYYDRGVPGLAVTSPHPMRGKKSKPEDDDDSDLLSPLQVIEDRIFRTVTRKTRDLDKSAGGNVVTDLINAKTLGEILEILQRAQTLIVAPRYINCDKSLVFILGNLDEAFHASDDLNPDLSADMFYAETSRVTISDIKEALKKRFRPEQIARFGNSIIKYPTLKREHFVDIISAEVERVCKEFKETSGIDIIVTQDFKDLLYSEAVYPTQGVRPIFTTIGTIFTPLLSKVVLAEPVGGSVEIGTEGTNFRKPDIIVTLTSKTSGEVIKQKVKLVLGELRDPSKRKTRVCSSVHETGHAIIMSYLTGKVPESIVSVSTDKGGFCVTFDEDSIGEIDSVRDVDNSVMISMGGWCAERLVFGDDSVLIGSGSDIDSAWGTFSSAVYSGGYYNPFSYVNLQVNNTSTGIPDGFRDDDVLGMVHDKFQEFRKRVEKILSDNKELLGRCAKELSEKGAMSGEELKDMIRKNTTGTLTLGHMESVRNQGGYDKGLEKFMMG